MKLIIAGGGTGGHFFPGVAVLDALRSRIDVDVVFVGTERGIEARRVPEMGERLICVTTRPLKGRNVKERLMGALSLPKSMLEALALVREEAPDVVLGVGGFASGPVLLAAALLRQPAALMEQNARAGMTNRWLSRFVRRAYLSYDVTTRDFRPETVRLLGNPIRKEIRDTAAAAAADPAAFEMRADTILVLGGSLGAAPLNEAVPKLLAECAGEFPVWHQVGPKGDVASVKQVYANAGIEARVDPFIDDMAGAFERAALVIARAGATSVAELTAIGRAAILVPYPFAADDHQTENAAALVASNAAYCVQQDQLPSEHTQKLIVDLLASADSRMRMAEQSRSLGKPDAADEIADDLINLTSRRKEASPPTEDDSGREGKITTGSTSTSSRSHMHVPHPALAKMRQDFVAKAQARPLIFGRDPVVDNPVASAVETAVSSDKKAQQIV